MTRDAFVEKVKEALGKLVVDFARPRDNRVYIYIEPEDIRKAAKVIFEELGSRFSIATGLDRREGVEILYHFYNDAAQVMVNLKTIVPKPALEIDTLSDLIWGTNWIEREIHEFLGVNFKGHPNLERLLLSDDWPEGVYPYRREFENEQ